MVLTTPEALEQRTVLATRTVEELQGYGLRVNDTVANVASRATASFNTHQEVRDTTFVDRIRADLVRQYGGANADGALSIMRARDFVIHDLERATRSYDSFLDYRMPPSVVADNLQTLGDEISRYRNLNRFNHQMDSFAREAELAINRLQRNLREFPVGSEDRTRALNEIFRDFGTLESSINNFAIATNQQIATLIRDGEAQTTQVAQIQRPPQASQPTTISEAPRIASVRTRERVERYEFGSMRYGGTVEIPREQPIAPPVVATRPNAPVQRPVIQETPVTQEPLRQPEPPSRVAQAPPIITAPVRPVEVVRTPEVVTPPRTRQYEPIVPIMPEPPQVTVAPRPTVATTPPTERPVATQAEPTIDITAPSSTRLVGMRLARERLEQPAAERAQHPLEQFTTDQWREVEQVFSDLRSRRSYYPNLTQAWVDPQIGYEHLIQEYRQNGRIGFATALQNMCYEATGRNPDSISIDTNIERLTASVRREGQRTTEQVAQVQPTGRQNTAQQAPIENPYEVRFRERISDANAVADGVHTAAARVHQARLDAEAAARAGDVTALEAAQRTAREANNGMENSLTAFNNNVGYARGAKNQLSRTEQAPLERTLRDLERRRNEITRDQTAASADMAAMSRITVQRTEVVVERQVRAVERQNIQTEILTPQSLTRMNGMLRSISGANLAVAEAQGRLRVLFELEQIRIVSLSDLETTITAICNPANPASTERKTTDVNRAILRYESEVLVSGYQRFTPEGGAYLRDNESSALESRLQRLQGVVNNTLRGTSTYSPETSNEIQTIVDAFRRVHEIAVQNLDYTESERQIRTVLAQAGLITSA